MRRGPRPLDSTRTDSIQGTTCICFSSAERRSPFTSGPGREVSNERHPSSRVHPVGHAVRAGALLALRARRHPPSIGRRRRATQQSPPPSSATRHRRTIRSTPTSSTSRRPASGSPCDSKATRLRGTSTVARLRLEDDRGKKIADVAGAEPLTLDAALPRAGTYSLIDEETPKDPNAFRGYYRLRVKSGSGATLMLEPQRSVERGVAALRRSRAT